MLVVEAAPSLKRAVEAWFERGELTTTAPIIIRVIESAVVVPPRADPPVNDRDGGMIWIPSASASSIDIYWPERRSAVAVDMAAGSATITVSPEVVREFEHHAQWALVAPAALLLRRDGRFHLHAAAARSPLGRGWLIVGDSASGKSTTAAAMARRGWVVATDDVAFLERAANGEAVIRGLRSQIALRPAGLELLKAAGGDGLGPRTKEGYWPERLGGAWEPTVVPDVVVFTQVSTGETVLERISRGTALKGIFQRSSWSLLAPDRALEHLELVRDVVARAECFSARIAPDLLAAPGLFEDFLNRSHDAVRS